MLLIKSLHRSDEYSLAPDGLLIRYILQEMANPRIRPLLHFYPEDTGGRHLTEARQAERWLKEVPNDMLTPMLRCGTRDFYVHEPAMLRSGQVCMPVRWFSRLEAGVRVWYAKCWAMDVVTTDSSQGWRVFERVDHEIRADHLLKTFTELRADAAHYNLPDPCKIIGECAPYSKCTYAKADHVTSI